MGGVQPRFLLIKKVRRAFLANKVPQEPRLIRPSLKSPELHQNVSGGKGQT